VKEKILHNLGTKLLSLILALLFWVLVINIDDPVRTRQFTNIPVTITNEKALTTLDKVYEVTQGRTVDITVSGKKSLVDKVTSQDLQATVDLSQLSMVNAVNIYPECTKYPSLVCTLGRVQTLKVSLEDMKSASLVPVIQQIGKVADGYYVVNATSTPNIIKVTGARSQIKKVHEIRLDADVSNAKRDRSSMAEPKAYDSNGEELDSAKLKFSVETAKVELHVRKTKSIPVLVEIEQGTADGYECSSVEYEPKKIVIAGREKKIADIEELRIPLDISQWNTSGEVTVNAADYLPEHITVAEANPTIGIHLEIEQWITKSFSFQGSEIKLQGKYDNRTYKRLHKNRVYAVTIYGKESVLEGLESSDLKPYVDVSDLERGKQEVEIQFENIESSRYLKNDLTLELQIS